MSINISQPCQPHVIKESEPLSHLLMVSYVYMKITSRISLLYATVLCTVCVPSYNIYTDEYEYAHFTAINIHSNEIKFSCPYALKQLTLNNSCTGV